VKRTLLLEGRTIPYELTQKPVKNINIRVHADGSVKVSAGPWVSPEAVDAVLRQRSAFLLRALDQFAAQAPLRPKAHTYGPGDTVYLLGKPYPLRLQPGPKVEVRQTPSHLLLTLPDPEDPQRRVRAMEAFLKQTCSCAANTSPNWPPLGCRCQRFACGL